MSKPENGPPGQAKRKFDIDDETLEIILQVADYVSKTKDTKFSLILSALNRIEVKQRLTLEAVQLLLQGGTPDNAVLEALTAKLTAEATSLEDSVRAASE